MVTWKREAWIPTDLSSLMTLLCILHPQNRRLTRASHLSDLAKLSCGWCGFNKKKKKKEHSHRIRNSYKFTTFIPGLKTVQTCACALVHNSAIILFHYAQSTAGNTFWMQLFLMLDINETPAQATAGQLLDPQFGIIGVTQHWQGHK